MLAAGYMAKNVKTRLDSLKMAGVEEIFSVSNCISTAFSDYVGFWRHNGFWFFNSTRDITSLARDAAIDLSGTTMFYYEVFENEFDGDARAWSTFARDESLPTQVEASAGAWLAGYDVTTFSMRAYPECSPLSCNALARDIPVNRNCLFDTFEQASSALEEGKFDNSEPGPFRIFAVYRV